MSQKMIMYHKVKAPHGEAVECSSYDSLISSGWVTGPQYFSKDEIVSDHMEDKVEAKTIASDPQEIQVETNTKLRRKNRFA